MDCDDSNRRSNSPKWVSVRSHLSHALYPTLEKLQPREPKVVMWELSRARWCLEAWYDRAAAELARPSGALLLR